MTDAKEPTLTPAQRAAAVDRIHENIALRSGAGCGKTFVLARRFTELLLASPDENPLRRFVALTFTEKAAMEMSQRVRAILTDLAAEAKGQDRRKIIGWLEEIDQARISTIHSFCSSLLRTYAVQAGVDPNFSVCPDKLTVNQMSDDAVEQAILEAVREERRDVAPLLSAMSFESLARQVSTLLDNRTGWQADRYALPEATLSRWRELLSARRQKAWQDFERDEKIAALVRRLQAMQCSDRCDKLFGPVSNRLAIVARMLASTAERTSQAFAAMAENVGRGGSDKAWGSKGSAKAVRDDLNALQRAVEPYATFAEELGEADIQAADALATLTSLAQRAGEIFTSAKRKLGILDFTDLLHYSHRLLTENGEIRQAVRRQIDQMLIDECQDTDAFQITLLGLAIFADDADDGQIPEGRLFFVGDAKQSIYRFRGAQVEIFEKLCSRLGASKQINLDLSFRTHQAGAAFANTLFARLMDNDYSPIEAHRTFNAAPQRGATVEILLASPATEIKSANDASKIQAAATAARIAEMLADSEKLVWDRAKNSWRPVQARDIAILFARMTTSLDYEQELARRNIPYYVVAGTGFFRQQEVFDILNILQSIDNPFDDLAFFGTLRSGMVGLDDNAMMHIARQFDPPYLPKMIAVNRDLKDHNKGLTVNGLSESQNVALRFAVGLTSRLHRIKDAVGVDELIRRVLDATGYEAVLLSQFNGRRMLGNIRMVIEQARSSAAMALADFVNQMRRRVMDESRYEQAAVAGEGENVVRIMTIHKAKGLEFPVVFLPDLNAARRKFSASLLNRADWGLTYRFKPGADEEADTDEDAHDNSSYDAPDASVAYRMACLEENKDAAAEDIRRFYVAVTRHEDHIVLVGADWRTKEGALRQTGSYIKMLDDALGVSAAVDAGRATLTYGPANEYIATVRRYTPAGAKYIAKQKSPGETVMESAACGQDVIDTIPTAGNKDVSVNKLFLASPLPLETAGVEIAVTVLGDFAKCPMLYRWRYELRVPRLDVCGIGPNNAAAAPADAVPESGSLDAATLGTLLHGCMEHLDFAHPQDALSLVAAKAQEMSLTDSIDLPAVAAEFSQMIAKLQAQPIWTELSAAGKIYRELDFVMELPSAVIRGQIDLIYQDACGQWHIVDYKSDRIGNEGVATHVDRYRQQMLLYSSAAARYMGRPPADATIYFLRTGQVSRLIVTPQMLAESQEQVRRLACELIACRRNGRFEQREGRHCEYCQYSRLCVATV